MKGFLIYVSLLIRTSRESPSADIDDGRIGVYDIAHPITTGSGCQSGRKWGTSSHRSSHDRDARSYICLYARIPCLSSCCHTRLWESSPCSGLLECPEWLSASSDKWRQWNNSRSRNHDHSSSHSYWRICDGSRLEGIGTAREEPESEDSDNAEWFLHNWEVEDIPTRQLYAIAIEMQVSQLYCIKWLPLKYPCSQTEYDRRIYEWEDECNEICINIYDCCRCDEIFEIEWFEIRE